MTCASHGVGHGFIDSTAAADYNVVAKYLFARIV